MVCLDKVLSRVRELRELVGSLKAMWPSEPMPRICRSIPPHSVIRSSYHVQKAGRSEEHTSELQSQSNLVCRLLLEKKKESDRLAHFRLIKSSVCIAAI